MSIPERLFRIARGYWTAREETALDADELRAKANAYEELAEALRVEPAPSEERPSTVRSTSVRAPAPQPAVSAGGAHYDPLDVCYQVLRLEPGCGLNEIEVAYHARLDELDPERHPEGSPERATLESKRGVIQAAYDRLRDSLNPTESRIEHLEF